MTIERNKRIIFSLRMESNHAPPAFRVDVLTTVLERSVDHSFRSVLCSKGNTSNITVTTHSFPIFETKIRICTIIFFFLLPRTMISGVVFREFRAKILRKLTFASEYLLGNARNSSQRF